VKIKRYVDADMRKVLRRVREDQGPDAVILSNRRTAEGIEVIAAIDYDESILQQALGSQPGAADYLRIAEPAEETAPAPAAAPVPAARKTTLQREPERAPERDIEVVGADLRLIRSEESLEVMRSELDSIRGLVESQLSELVWKEEARRSPTRAQMLRNLARIGISPDIASVVISRLKAMPETKQIWRAPLTELVEMIPVKADDLLMKGGVVALIGPTGVGKTTSIAKIAARYAMAHGSDDIALVCADSYRIGAKEHLAAFGQIIGVRVHSANESGDLTDLLERLKSKKLVLIDTDGVSQRDINLSSRLATYGRHIDRVRFYLTLSAAAQESALDETIRRFSAVPLAGAVVSKIDEAGQLGCVMNALIRHDLPALWFSDGQRIPDDFHEAAKKRLWLVIQAIECMEAGDPKIDEHMMAERYGRASAAHV
jgi:flagellar biosynthesis protein FlhF